MRRIEPNLTATPANRMNDYVPTWDDPIGPNAWSRLNWEGMGELHDGLTMIVAYSPNQRLQAVGTGFVISRLEEGAVCVTAAHNFYLGVHNVQFPNRRHHHSTPPEFQPNFERVELARTFAIFRKGEVVLVTRIVGACWDKQRDLCVFEVQPHDEDRPHFDPRVFRIAAEQPLHGQRVAIVGYAGLENLEHENGTAGNIASRLEVRVGKVLSVNDGLLVPGRVAETTIPVFSGMSGSPALLWGNFNDVPLVFGLVTSDAEPADISEKEDFSRPGRSQVSMLDVECIALSGNELTVHLKIGPIAGALGQMRSPFRRMVEDLISIPGGASIMLNSDLKTRDVSDGRQNLRSD